ncbi:anthranilate synthase component II [Carboxydichorda subterranea]|uniref:anthranilate synthase component II n=1 Tax=Carboxydichorda subterranea TaxID=3109565 RepID=UPI0038575D5B
MAAQEDHAAIEREAPVPPGPVVVIDNYDSFVYNLAHYLGEMGAEVQVIRNDRATVDEVLAMHPAAIVISPGPGRPEEAGISVELVRRSGGVPLLGVCLGHQAIGAAFGGRIIRADRLLHGKASPILHDGRTIYRGIPSPFEAGRYHSLCIAREPLPPELEVSAVDETGCIMGVRHRTLPIEGVQFHPESILTRTYGRRILVNFLAEAAGRARAERRA